MKHDLAELTAIASRIRGKVVQMSNSSGAAHLASSLSCVDILVAAYWETLEIDPARPDDPGRDRLLFSKGHAAAALYATLAYRGFCPLELLDRYAQAGSCLPEHPSSSCVPGVEIASGSLGHGLSLGLGMALARKAVPASRIQAHDSAQSRARH